MIENSSLTVGDCCIPPKASTAWTDLPFQSPHLLSVVASAGSICPEIQGQSLVGQWSWTAQRLKANGGTLQSPPGRTVSAIQTGEGLQQVLD